MPDFSKRHYEEIANLIKDLPYEMRFVVAQRFANYLEYDNPRFDRDKFLKACQG